MPDGGERSERERKSEKKKRLKTHTGDCTRKLFPKTINCEKGESLNTTNFL